MSEQEDFAPRILRLILEDKWGAHQVLFAHRHQDGSRPVMPAEFHPELVADFWSDDEYSIRFAFRGSAKSTLAEEDIVLLASLSGLGPRLPPICAKYGLPPFWPAHNILIVSASEARAAERLAPIAHELAVNEFMIPLFGEQKGDIWTQTKIVTPQGVCIQAMGRDQDIRGIRYMEYRPDFVLIDDVESPDSVQTPEQRRKTLRWLLSELLPACAPRRRVRVRATPMDAESLPVKLMREWGWPCRTYPVEYTDDKGQRRATWPQTWPLEKIDRERRGYEKVGELGVFLREYLCEIYSEADRVFDRAMVRVVPRERDWHACFAMIDPARTVSRTSATTGWAVWSWINNRLVVWAADAQLLLPDEIVALCFDLAERFDPVWVGIEQDGLEEFLLQPLRHEAVRRGCYLPFRGLRAPRGKLDFIRGLQPFFSAREVEFAQPLPALTEQLLNFPTGRIDAPNALAYALQMRPGLPIYESFTAEHIVEEADSDRTMPLYLAANASGSMVTAALLQYLDGRLSILADWVREGSAAEIVPEIHAEAVMGIDSVRENIERHRPRAWDDMLKAPAPDRIVLRRTPPVWVVPPHHGERYNNVGLVQSLRAVPANYRLGGLEAQGKVQLHDLLGKLSRGLPAAQVGRHAQWTLRALSGGYARAFHKGRLQEWAEEGPYRLLMEGIESFLALSRLTRQDDEDDDIGQPYAFDRFGRRYKTAMPQR